MTHPASSRRPAPGAREDSRDRIIDAALRLFARQGFGATTTKSIATEAGVASGLVFYYFSSKQELLETMLAERSFASQLERILLSADPGDPVGTLRTIGHRFEDVLVEHRDLIRILLTAATPGSAAHESFRALLRGQLTGLSDYLLTAFGTQSLEPQRARAISRAFMATIVYTTVVVPLDADASSAYIDDTIEALLAGRRPLQDW